MRKKGACFTISVVADMYGVHPQTLRTYERAGLLKPSRSEGNTRLYTDQDLERLELITNLTRELGVNLAGVEVILNMRDKMEAMRSEVEQLLEFVRRRFGVEGDFVADRLQNALIPVPPSHIVPVRRRSAKEAVE